MRINPKPILFDTRKSSEGNLTKNSSKNNQNKNDMYQDISWMQYLINNKSGDSKALSNSNNNNTNTNVDTTNTHNTKKETSFRLKEKVISANNIEKIDEKFLDGQSNYQSLNEKILKVEEEKTNSEFMIQDNKDITYSNIERKTCSNKGINSKYDIWKQNEDISSNEKLELEKLNRSQNFYKDACDLETWTTIPACILVLNLKFSFEKNLDTKILLIKFIV